MTHFFADCVSPLDQDDLTLVGCPIHGICDHFFDQCFHPSAYTKESIDLCLRKHRLGKAMIHSQYYANLSIDWSLFCDQRPLTPQEVRDKLSELANWRNYEYPNKPQVAKARKVALIIESRILLTYTPRIRSPSVTPNSRLSPTNSSPHHSPSFPNFNDNHIQSRKRQGSFTDEASRK